MKAKYRNTSQYSVKISQYITIRFSCIMTPLVHQTPEDFIMLVTIKGTSVHGLLAVGLEQATHTSPTD